MDFFELIENLPLMTIDPNITFEKEEVKNIVLVVSVMIASS